jgi:protein-disulfide isomerase
MSLDDRIEYLRKKGLEKRRSSAWYKKWWGILLIIIVITISSLAMSFAFLVVRFMNNPLELGQLNREDALSSINDPQANVRIVEGPGRYYLGPEDPQATIVVFSDISCPFSKQAADTMRSLNIIYREKIKIIPRDFPVVSEDSLDLAMVSRCAGEQGKYWEMYFKLFELQGQIQDLGIGHIVALVGINNLDSFYSCIDNQKYLNDISKDFSDAQFLQIKGAPTWFLDANKIAEGNVPLGELRDFLDEYLELKESLID